MTGDSWTPRHASKAPQQLVTQQHQANLRKAAAWPTMRMKRSRMEQTRRWRRLPVMLLVRRAGRAARSAAHGGGAADRQAGRGNMASVGKGVSAGNVSMCPAFCVLVCMR